MEAQSPNHWTAREFPEFTFLTCSQVMLILLVWEPYFENQWCVIGICSFIQQVYIPGTILDTGVIAGNKRDKASIHLKFSLDFFFLLLIATLFIYLFIYLFLAVLGLRFVRGLSLVAASGGHSSSWCGGHSSSRCTGLSLSRPLPLQGTGSRRAGSAVVAHGPSCSTACGIFPDQGSNPCPLH